jgi:hypothetical protein
MIVKGMVNNTLIVTKGLGQRELFPSQHHSKSGEGEDTSYD